MAKRLPVRRPYETIVASVANQSARNGTMPRLIVLHDTESHDRGGNSDLASLVAWFDNPAAQASAHVIVDGEGRSAQCVADGQKAWHCADFNSVSLGIEQVGFATFTQTLWNRNKRAQLLKVAKYIAHWSKKYGIPIQQAKVGTSGNVWTPGVTTHASLGVSGGGHHDPGKGYPFGSVLRAAKYFKSAGWPH